MANVSESPRPPENRAPVNENTFWVIVFLVVVFAFSVWLKPGLYDYDSYHFASVGCDEKWKPENAEFFEYVFLDFGCNIAEYKAILVPIFAVCLLFLWLAGRFLHAGKEIYLVLGLFFLMGIMGFFARVENDTIGLLFLFASFAALCMFHVFNKRSHAFISIGLALVGGLVWKALWVWAVLVVAVAWPAVGLFAFPVAFFFVYQSLAATAEQSAIIGLVSTAFYWLFVDSLPKRFWIATFLAVILAVFSIKYSLFLALFLNLALFEYARKNNFFEGQRTPIGEKKWVFLGFALVFFIAGSLAIITAQPTLEQLNQTRLAINVAHGEPIVNDFENGHLLSFYGGNPVKRFGPPNPDMNGPGIKWTRLDLDCEVLSRVRVQDYNSTVYRCT